MIGCFVTGTDTGVGKTLASAGLLHALARHHARVVGMKAIAAGAEPIGPGGTLANEDVLALRAASTVQVAPALDNPVLLPDPLSPHIAARRAGTRIDIAAIVQACGALAAQADAVVVEGAGGFHVPLSDTETGADLAQALGLPVVLVVGLRLGCLSHAALTADAIRARGLPLAGWIASRIDPAMLAAEDNIAWLRQRLQAPLLADIPHQRQPDPRATPFTLPDSWTTPSA
ncbi:dethiobiotin synthase [Paracidovorax avenae]|uniref:ATP-dependent dethiobiotin synthetase BioD n=1 Tax=Paracidovorax avenae (strain ATCC 19860 / DSM 7227 / CCUG 15838 / JCM 20985 / LMG 2117 / NCPPB 1011) TaxID=643561 RepID=F0Q0X4_PARA1|nr:MULTISPECIES: dethiobiotin synthase [Comamonadaceae]ADX47641.1 dethiobiotin synthase [Paracidovorax avenae ATCC 19860]AVS71647.1 dethiobiotin synthase [Paracidovorax avenae]AVS78722.1 dethiobiotin synthase [Paracidovorax avenae]AVS82310.1 dethiobiotin synthase [Paracidovorax avenae]AVS93745.1 dethiobiotin synthase [Paracidovorax avenae]